MSTPLAAIIVFIGAITFVASAANLTVNIMQSLAELSLNVSNHSNRAYTRVEISETTISNGIITLLIKNLGPETIFLVDQGYKWCSIIISYNSDSGWITYLLDDYNVTDIIVLNSNLTCSGLKRGAINPGEGAWIIAKLPEGAPEVIEGSLVTIVFSTGFGESSRLVVVKDD